MNGEVDPRFTHHELGLAVIAGDNAKFHPRRAQAKGESLTDVGDSRSLTVTRDPADGVLWAAWSVEPDNPPMQLLTRWYGFACTYPDGDVYEPGGSSLIGVCASSA